ncbi:pilus assembly protein TadD, partial [Prosthecomicrobium hirschii]
MSHLPRPLPVLALAVTAALIVGGCARKPQQPDPATTGSIGPQAEETLKTSVDSWAKRYVEAPENRDAILGYAQALRLNGQTQQSVEVLRRAILVYPKDGQIASAYGKA